jgi:hypothetical protein
MGKKLQQFLGGCIPKRLPSSRRDNKEPATYSNPQKDTLTQELLWPESALGRGAISG